jgi:hypothetical protein
MLETCLSELNQTGSTNLGGLAKFITDDFGVAAILLQPTHSHQKA